MGQEALEGDLEKRIRRLESAWSFRLFAYTTVAALVVLVLLGAALLLYMDPATRPAPLSLAAIQSLSPEQIQAARSLVQSELREEVLSYRSIASYLKIALPFVVTGVVALAWGLIRNLVDARAAESELRIREKTAEDMRKRLDESLERFETSARLQATRVESSIEENAPRITRALEKLESERLIWDLMLDVNLAFVLWSAEKHGRAAGYGERSLEKLKSILESPLVPEARRDQLRSRDVPVDVAYYHAAHYAAVADRESAMRALELIDPYLDRAEQPNADLKIVDGVLFVIAKTNGECAPRHRQHWLSIYGEHRSRVDLYLSQNVSGSGAREILTTYDAFQRQLEAQPLTAEALSTAGPADPSR